MIPTKSRAEAFPIQNQAEDFPIQPKRSPNPNRLPFPEYLPHLIPNCFHQLTVVELITAIYHLIPQYGENLNDIKSKLVCSLFSKLDSTMSIKIEVTKSRELVDKLIRILGWLQINKYYKDETTNLTALIAEICGHAIETEKLLSELFFDEHNLTVLENLMYRYKSRNECYENEALIMNDAFPLIQEIEVDEARYKKMLKEVSEKKPSSNRRKNSKIVSKVQEEFSKKLARDMCERKINKYLDLEDETNLDLLDYYLELRESLD